jgi:hypothetical protein
MKVKKYVAVHGQEWPVFFGESESGALSLPGRAGHLPLPKPDEPVPKA